MSKRSQTGTTDMLSATQSHTPTHELTHSNISQPSPQNLSPAHFEAANFGAKHLATIPTSFPPFGTSLNS